MVSPIRARAREAALGLDTASRVTPLEARLAQPPCRLAARKPAVGGAGTSLPPYEPNGCEVVTKWVQL